VVVQAESNAQGSEQSAAEFFDYGERLIREAQTTGGTPTVIVNWVYGEKLFEGRGAGMCAWYYGRIQSDYARLSSMTGARLINVAQVWACTPRRRSCRFIRTATTRPCKAATSRH